MIDRYTLPKMGGIWSEQAKFQSWLEVELAICEAQEHFGLIPEHSTETIRSKASFTVKRIEEIERETHHDLIAFVKAVTENMGDEGRYVHYGVTSYDIEDTAMALRMRDSAELIIEDLERLKAVVARLAKEHKLTPMIGRTHGVHAEPITFGFKMAVWYSQIERDIERVRTAQTAVSAGKISGAVGIFGNTDPRIEEYVCEKLSLSAAPVSTQIVQRDRHAQMLCALAIAASSAENFATEIQRIWEENGVRPVH